MSMTFGGYEFSDPVRIDRWDPPYRAGVYAILRRDYSHTPSYAVIYFGQSSNMSERGFVKSHHRYSCFVNTARAESNLYRYALYAESD